MVSLRRRKLMGLCAGRASTSTEIPSTNAEVIAVGVGSSNSARSINVRSMPLVSLIHKKEEQIGPAEAFSLPPLNSGSSSSKDEPVHEYQIPEVKRRKRHRRKNIDNRELCIMRGVYFKNMKWQAAIKVDKKQIHLGTVGSQEAAAKLYDRAAFMCGREPNCELSEEEKRELRQFKWDEFLAVTRNAITSKKNHRRLGAAAIRRYESETEFHGDSEHGVRASSASDGVDGDASAS